MLPERVPSDPEPKKEKDERRKIIIALLFLLLSFSCIFCSSQSALWLIDRDRIEASMLSNKSADYGSGPAIALAPLSGDIAAEAEHDEAALLAKQTPIASGLGVVILPNPIPTPQPTIIALLPTPTLTPTISAPPAPAPATPTPGAPPPTSALPTSLPPTSPPTVPLPTLPPSTVPPTVPPPTVPPPTSPPPTSPPPTSPPPTSPSSTATSVPVTVFLAASSFNINESTGVTPIIVNLSRVSALTVTVNYATSNGTATAGSDYTGTSGILTFAPGVTSQAFPVTILNDTLDELNETVALALSAPTNATLGAPSSATLTIIDDDAPPTVQFSAGSYAVSEAAGTVPVTVTLSGVSALTVTVNYASSNGTATAGSDYTGGTSGVLTFPPGVTSQTFPVIILDDTLDELDETIFLALSAPINATLGSPSSATLTIVDDDVSPTVQFSSSTYSVGEAGGTTSVTVNLSTASGLTVTVNYATSDGTATAGSDYTATNGALTFAPGVTSQTFPVTILDDVFDEADETVALALSAPINAALGVPNAATLTIVDDDVPPTVQFSTGSYTVNENAVTAPITVTLSTTSALTVTVDFISGDLTATVGSDYLAATGTLTFAPGITSRNFSVTINDDNLDEPDEMARLTLTTPINATLGAPITAILTIVFDAGDISATCPGLYPNGEPNVGQPNGVFARIACDVSMVIDLGTSITVLGDNNPDFDLVYYEIQGVNPVPVPPEQIYMDLMIIEVAQSPSGPWYPVFNWGDSGPDGNTNIGQAGFSPAENDNTLIPMTSPPLYGTAPYTTGITIDVDAPLTIAGAPPGTYQYIRLYSPPGGGNDGPTVDAIEVLP